MGQLTNMSDTHTLIELSEGTEDDRRYEGALNAVLHMDKKDYPSLVGGLKVASGHDYPVFSPIDDSIIFGTFQEPEDGLTDTAVNAALKSFKTWSESTENERIEIFDDILDSIIKQRYRLAALLTVCAGMTREDAFDEVDRLIETIDEACQDTSEGLNGKPMGVWALFTSYNSPLAAPIGYAVAAMIAGNTVVAIPSKYVPVPIYAIYDIMERAGLPDGVFNIITDRFDGSTNALANNMDIAGIIVAGSGTRLENLMFMQADDEIKFVNETKGMNPIFVYHPHSMKEAASIIVDSAVAFSGQRMDSCSKVVVTMEEKNTFLKELLDAIKKVKIGDPAELGINMGPLISEKKYDEFMDIVNKNSQYLVYGGKRIQTPETEAGFYVVPAIFMGVPEDDDICFMDSSLPILSIQLVEDIDEAVDAINFTEYGMSAGIITKDQSAAEQFVREVNADEIFINDSSSIIGPACKAKVENFLH